jgi:hypothetical protein
VIATDSESYVSIPPPDRASQIEEHIRREIESLREILEIRLNAIDKETRVLQENLKSVPDEVDRRIAQLNLLYDAKFSALEKAREKAEAVQREHNMSQKEWTSGINDLIKTITDRARVDRENMINALRDNTNNSIVNLTDKTDRAIARLDKAEGQGAGSSSTKSTLIALAAIAISFVMAALTIISFMREKTEPQISVNPPETLQKPNTGQSSVPPM